MRVNSFMRQGSELVPVSVEVILTPGLPLIQILGLPDSALRESALRVRTAIRKQGFRLPKGQRILVHLQPAHLRKSSRGLDLAIAAAILWETGQIERPDYVPWAYGELSLSGDVTSPDDTLQIHTEIPTPLVTGGGDDVLSLPYVRLGTLKTLASLKNLEVSPGNSVADGSQFPNLPRHLFFPKRAARIAMVIAAGEHGALIAGPSGTGKTTLVDAIPSWLAEAECNKTSGSARSFNRPVLKPHHSATRPAMIGGGAQALAGEISRANGGVLILDELLRFDPHVQEALREPMETGRIKLSRAGVTRTHPADFLLLATTNLCECGQFVPSLNVDTLCRCSRTKRGRVLGRLSGPFADRFQILTFSDDWSRMGPLIGCEEILKTVQDAIRFRIVQRAQEEPNARTEFTGRSFGVEPHWETRFKDLVSPTSIRRHDAVLRVARTLADLRLSPGIEAEDLNEAISLAWRGHRLLEEWRD